MEKQFIPYELALKLKELGFNEECFCIYSNKNFILVKHGRVEKNSNIEETWDMMYMSDCKSTEQLYETSCTAPLWQQSFYWFREEKDLYADIYRTGNLFSANIEDMLMGNSLCEVVKEVSYEEARLKCLEKLIELCKNN